MGSGHVGWDLPMIFHGWCKINQAAIGFSQRHSPVMLVSHQGCPPWMPSVSPWQRFFAMGSVGLMSCSTMLISDTIWYLNYVTCAVHPGGLLLFFCHRPGLFGAFTLPGGLRPSDFSEGQLWKLVAEFSQAVKPKHLGVCTAQTCQMDSCHLRLFGSRSFLWPSPLPLEAAPFTTDENTE